MRLDAESKGPGGFAPTSFGGVSSRREPCCLWMEERKTALQEGTDVFGAHRVRPPVSREVRFLKPGSAS